MKKFNSHLFISRISYEFVFSFVQGSTYQVRLAAATTPKTVHALHEQTQFTLSQH